MLGRDYIRDVAPLSRTNLRIVSWIGEDSIVISTILVHGDEPETWIYVEIEMGRLDRKSIKIWKIRELLYEWLHCRIECYQPSYRDTLLLYASTQNPWLDGRCKDLKTEADYASLRPLPMYRPALAAEDAAKVDSKDTLTLLSIFTRRKRWVLKPTKIKPTLTAMRTNTKESTDRGSKETGSNPIEGDALDELGSFGKFG
ncbi:hypothetical protein SISSUDRAFT_1036341 [Sistotremastrum suecicum HHB10207 ss-3]|uniref:Uncharacterized protein n=1 Tax=Sistotremastrum suecicum HHB10207 ss-3 TaxID=1314776 RepID=A0A165ZKM0_9AGAM|nr:hypothetical protein SISSUDRAFT_1036341 [Sistotremastrum suecicum HHB10207 ss-3]